VCVLVPAAEQAVAFAMALQAASHRIAQRAPVPRWREAPRSAAPCSETLRAAPQALVPAAASTSVAWQSFMSTLSLHQAPTPSPRRSLLAARHSSHPIRPFQSTAETIKGIAKTHGEKLQPADRRATAPPRAAPRPQRPARPARRRAARRIASLAAGRSPT
jgi:hypothetical protein